MDDFALASWSVIVELLKGSVLIWSGSVKRRFFAVLHTARINSALEAVRAAIVAERRTTR
jgi:hypothetical protein